MARSKSAGARALLGRPPDVVWTSNDADQITFLTANVRSILGFSPDEIIASGGESWAPRIHASDLHLVRCAYEALKAARGALDVECRWQRRDGHWIWIRARAIAFYEMDGSRCFEGTLSDITQAKQLEEALRQAQKMEILGQSTGGTGPDFNNLLTAILGNARFMSDALDACDPRRIDAEAIRWAAERAAGLTRQLLAFSRPQALEPSIDLNAILEGIRDRLRRLAGQDIEVSFVPGARLGAVRADASQIEQVIMNLTVNARDAMPLGGELSIETANVELEADPTSTVAIAPGRYVMIALTDTGCGIDAETKRRIFEPFFTTKEPSKGTGLGLSTCCSIVEQRGGCIRAYSELGEGSVFRVYLPRVDAPSLPAQERSSWLR